MRSTSTLHESGAGPLATPAYIVAAIMLIMPLADAAAAIGTFSPTAYRWRFGVMGILSANIITPLFAVLLALTVAWLQSHRWVIRILMAGTLMTSVLLVAATVLFVLDGLQLRAEVPDEARRGFMLAAGKALFAQVLLLAGIVSLFIASRRASRGLGSAERTSRDRSGDLVMAGGRSPGAAGAGKAEFSTA